MGRERHCGGWSWAPAAAHHIPPKAVDGAPDTACCFWEPLGGEIPWNIYRRTSPITIASGSASLTKPITPSNARQARHGSCNGQCILSHLKSESLSPCTLWWALQAASLWPRIEEIGSISKGADMPNLRWMESLPSNGTFRQSQSANEFTKLPAVIFRRSRQSRVVPERVRREWKADVGADL